MYDCVLQSQNSGTERKKSGERRVSEGLDQVQGRIEKIRGIMLSEISQPQRDKYCMISFICVI